MSEAKPVNVLNAPPASGPIVGLVKMITKPEHAAAVTALLAEDAQYGKESEPGQVAFHVARRDDTFFVWDSYVDAAAVEFHKQNNKPFQTLLARAGEFFVEPPEIQFLVPEPEAQTAKSE